MTFAAATMLTRMNLSATSGGKLLFAAATTYTSASAGSYSISASGANSRIDLSHLTSLEGSYNAGNVAISAANGGQIDLAGALVGKASLTLSDTRVIRATRSL